MPQPNVLFSPSAMHIASASRPTAPLPYAASERKAAPDARDRIFPLDFVLDDHFERRPAVHPRRAHGGHCRFARARPPRPQRISVEAFRFEVLLPQRDAPAARHAASIASKPRSRKLYD